MFLEIWLLVEFVIEVVFLNFVVFYSNNFCNVFGKIVCIFCERGFFNVGGKRGGKRVFLLYSEVILLKDWFLVWSIVFIFSRLNVILLEYFWGVLYLRSFSSFFIVLRYF